MHYDGAMQPDLVRRTARGAPFAVGCNGASLMWGVFTKKTRTFFPFYELAHILLNVG
jgi:hypothetical protein